jgi:mono/diheme cytochrome c family protein
MKRWMAILALLTGAALLLGVGAPVLAQGGHGEETGQGEEGAGDDAGIAALRGAALYAEFCQACHGVRGEAQGALVPLAFEPESARQAIEDGVAPAEGLAMPAYGALLDEAQLGDLLAYLGTWDSQNVPPLPEPNIGDLPEQLEGLSGNPRAGAVIYATYCGGCHGVNGAGRGRAAFPPLKGTPADIVRVAREGHGDPSLPAFGQAQGGPLDEAQLIDLQAYLSTWPQQHQQETESQRGYGLLIVIVGAIAILLVGAIYMVRAQYRA